jgi:hypothetical protein
MIPQPKEEALSLARKIQSNLSKLQGENIGYGFVYDQGSLKPNNTDKDSIYLSDNNSNAITLFHYRNISDSTYQNPYEFHDLMHFGSLRAAQSRAFSQRFLQQNNGERFSEAHVATNMFNETASSLIGKNPTFGDEVLFSVHLKAQKPFFIPDIGQSHYFRNRAVLYASGLFEINEVDSNLFDDNGFPQEDIDQKVLDRLRDHGYDSIAYMNNIEDPGSLSFIVLGEAQIESVQMETQPFAGVRYGFGSVGGESVVEFSNDGHASIQSGKENPAINFLA